MRRSGKGSGGGLGMNKNVAPKVRTGAGGRAANPGYIAQLGERIGDHSTGHKSSTGYRGEIFHKGPAYNPVKFGNEIALNVGRGGPGKGREVMRCGSQGTHGSVNPGKSPTRRDILSDFGPDYKNERRR